MRTSLYTLLSVAGYPIVCDFPSGTAFLEDLSALNPGVVLLDYHMPGATGLDVLSALHADMRFSTIILTGEGCLALATQAMKAGAFDFLEKPCDPNHMPEAAVLAARRLTKGYDAAARTDAAKAKVNSLSPRELDVLSGLTHGQSNKAIGHALDISPGTVEVYRANIKDKLGVRSLSESLRIAFAAGL